VPTDAVVRYTVKDYLTNTWCGPRFHKDTKTVGKSDVRALLTYVDLVTVDDDFSQDEMIRGLAK
jgi:hypothetical protein